MVAVLRKTAPPFRWAISRAIECNVSMQSIVVP